MADADRCVCCGEIIPEGGQVCLICKGIPIKTEGVPIKVDRRLSWWKRLRIRFLSFWRR